MQINNISFILNLSTTQMKLQKKVDGLLSLHGISFTEFMILSFLNLQSTKMMRRIDLAQEIGLTASGITRLINPMQKIGLVTKEENPKDARVSFVKLTEAGETILEQSSKSLEQSLASVMININAKQLQTTQSVFHSLGATY